MYGVDVGWFRNMDDGWQCDQVTTLDDQEGCCCQMWKCQDIHGNMGICILQCSAV